MATFDKQFELLHNLHTMIKHEAQEWYHTKNSKTADKILHYEVLIGSLLELVRDHNTNAIILFFKIKNPSIKDIGDCFRRGPNALRRRNIARQLFKSFCDDMVGILEERNEIWMLDSDAIETT